MTGIRLEPRLSAWPYKPHLRLKAHTFSAQYATYTDLEMRFGNWSGPFHGLLQDLSTAGGKVFHDALDNKHKAF